MVNAAAATGELVPPKRIPVNGRPIRLRWLQQIIWSFLAANVGALIIAGLYYLVIQVRWHIGSDTYPLLDRKGSPGFGLAGPDRRIVDCYPPSSAGKCPRSSE